MAAKKKDHKVVVDIEHLEIINQLQLTISRIIPEQDFNTLPPFMCSTYYLDTELIVQVVLRHNPWTDEIETYLEVLAGPPEPLTFKIKYGFKPFKPFRDVADVYHYTPTIRVSDTYTVCRFSRLLEFLVENEVNMRFEYAQFICEVIITPTTVKTDPPVKYRIPRFNTSDCDHMLICGGAEVRVHRKLLMATSRFFYRLLMKYPSAKVTFIDRLEKSKRIEKDVLSCLVRFIYGLNISDHNLQTTCLLSAAREYEIHTLFRICEKTMIKQLCSKMAAELFYIGRTEKASQLAFEAAKFILANYRDVRRTYEWDGCMRAFPQFFRSIAPNPLRYFREIIHPEIRSRSTGDLWCEVSYVLGPPANVALRPLQPKVAEPDNARSIAESRSSNNTSLLSCASLDSDFQPMTRKRSSPVVSRRRAESMSDFRTGSLDESSPRWKFSRELLKNKLLNNEKKFEETFGAVDDTAETSDSSRSLSRTSSLPSRTSSYGESSESRSTNYKFHLNNPSFEEPMDVAEDSNLDSSSTSSKSKSASMGPSSPVRQPFHLSSASSSEMRSLQFGLSYSYSSDSVFERRETPKSMSKVPTPTDMSVSDIPSRHVETIETNVSPVSPKLMKRIDFGMYYTHPEARSLSDISSLPIDTSTSLEPESSLSSKSRSRREKRMKKTADKTRKFLPSTSLTAIPFDFLPSDSSSSAIIPRATLSKEFAKEKRQSPKSSTSAVVSELSSESSSSSSENKQPPKKVTFGATDYIPLPPAEEFHQEIDEELDQQFAELQLQQFEEADAEQTKYYECWLDTASFYNIPDVFTQATASRSDNQAHQVAEDVEKAWDEKDEEELTAPLRQKISEAEASTSGVTKKIKKESPTSSSDASSRQLPIGGGVIRKPRGRFQTASVDDPTPLSSSESVGTTSSSLSSTEHRKLKRTFVNRYNFDVATQSQHESNLEQGRPFVELRPARRPTNFPQQHRNTPALAGIFSIGVQPQAIRQLPNISMFVDIEAGKEPEKKKPHDKQLESEHDKQ